MKSCICDNMEGPRGYYDKLNKSDRERQILYDFTSMWNIKNKMNKHNKTETVIDTDNKQVVARGESVGAGKKEMRAIKRNNFQLQNK